MTMKKLEFRLQRVLDYRAMAEDWAKQAYLEAQARRVASEALLAGLKDRRAELLQQFTKDVEARLLLQAALDRTDAEEREQLTILEVLAAEEAKAYDDWRRAKMDLEIIEKLREKAASEWEKELARFEQKQLDDWASTRRAA